MGATTDRPPLAMLPVLDRAARVLADALGLEGRCRFEVIVDDDARVVELWPHQEPGKLTRGDLDRLTIPAGPD
jgi:hypothetical protein